MTISATLSFYKENSIAVEKLGTSLCKRTRAAQIRDRIRRKSESTL